MNPDEIKELLDAIADTDVTELLIQNEDGSKIRIRRGPQGPQAVTLQAPAQAFAAAPAVAAAPPLSVVSPVGEAAPAEAGGDESEYVTSPFVGTFYRAPSPEAQSYVEVGQPVKKGQVLCIIEAMKIMNEIEAERAGTVTEILADNGQAVEFGQRLFRVEAA